MILNDEWEMTLRPEEGELKSQYGCQEQVRWGKAKAYPCDSCKCVKPTTQYVFGSAEYVSYCDECNPFVHIELNEIEGNDER